MKWQFYVTASVLVLVFSSSAHPQVRTEAMWPSLSYVSIQKTAVLERENKGVQKDNTDAGTIQNREGLTWIHFAV